MIAIRNPSAEVISALGNPVSIAEGRGVVVFLYPDAVASRVSWSEGTGIVAILSTPDGRVIVEDRTGQYPITKFL